MNARNLEYYKFCAPEFGAFVIIVVTNLSHRIYQADVAKHPSSLQCTGPRRVIEV